jgi:hypothetical protein
METPLISETALYLYGIVANPAPLPSCDAVEDGTTIDVIAGDGAACVVSPVPACNYAAAATGGNAAEQLQWVTPRAWRHHDVVRKLHLTTTVIPLKFGTLCASADDVRRLLRRCAEPIGALLHRFQDRDEWTLSIRFDRARVIERFEREDPELSALCERERLLPQGRAYFVRKQRQQHTDALVGSELAATTAVVYARISGLVDGWREEKNAAAPSATLLVERARVDELTACLAAMEHEHASNALELELRGPWAPYSFVDEIDCRELTPEAGIESRPSTREPRKA